VGFMGNAVGTISSKNKAHFRISLLHHLQPCLLVGFCSMVILNFGTLLRCAKFFYVSAFLNLITQSLRRIPHHYDSEVFHETDGLSLPSGRVKLCKITTPFLISESKSYV
jgi:hypothetical protein